MTRFDFCTDVDSGLVSAERFLGAAVEPGAGLSDTSCNKAACVRSTGTLHGHMVFPHHMTPSHDTLALFPMVLAKINTLKNTCRYHPSSLFQYALVAVETSPLGPGGGTSLNTMPPPPPPSMLTSLLIFNITSSRYYSGDEKVPAGHML